MSPAPSSLPLSVEITRGRGRLTLSAPLDLGPVRVGEMEVTIPRLRLPADLRGGAGAFHAHLSTLDRIRLTISGSDLLAAARAAGETRLRRVDLREDSVVVMAADEGHDLMARWRILPGIDGAIVLAPLDALVVGFTRRPWHLLAEELLAGLGASVGARREPDGTWIHLLPPVLDHLFLTAGWRVPAARLDVAALGTRSGKLTVEFAPADAVPAVQRRLGAGDEATDEIDRELLQRLDAARLHQDVDDAIREGDSAAALTTLWRARKEGEEWDAFLQERLVVLQACEPGLHDEALAEADRMIELGEGEVLARTSRVCVAAHRGESRSLADTGYDLASALVARGRRGAAGFVLEQIARRLGDAGEIRAALLDRAAELLPHDPGILATRAALLGAGVPLPDLLSSLPFLSSGAERAALLEAASRRMVGEGDLAGALAIWDAAGEDLHLPADLYSAAALTAAGADPETRRRLLDRLVTGQVAGDLDPAGAEALVVAALEVLPRDRLPGIAALLASALSAGGAVATRLMVALESALVPAEMLGLRKEMLPAVMDPDPAWVNLVFRVQVAAGEVDAAWASLTGEQAHFFPDDATLETILGLVPVSRTRALSEMVRWVERSPDRGRRAAVAGRLGTVLLEELGLGSDAVPYLSLAVQLDERPARWLAALERALEEAKRYEDWADLLVGVLADETLSPDAEGEAHLRLGRVLGRHLGRRDEAVEHLRRARTLLPGAPGPERELEEALARAEATSPRTATVPTLPSSPAGVQSQLDLACQDAFELADAGEMPAARAVLESILADDPKHSAARDLLELLDE